MGFKAIVIINQLTSCTLDGELQILFYSGKMAILFSHPLSLTHEFISIVGFIRLFGDNLLLKILL
ncbi:hypothetical protein [Spiroplasma poulsonii]